jgi:hypothetical protein
VRIAVSGTHRAGKSTLVGDLAEQLRGHRVVDEPYHLLEEEGFEFSDPPVLEDWVEQLRRSLEELEGDGSPDLLSDRCPLDLLAYAQVHEDGDGLDLEEWMPRSARRWERSTSSSESRSSIQTGSRWAPERTLRCGPRWTGSWPRCSRRTRSGSSWRS